MHVCVCSCKCCWWWCVCVCVCVLLLLTVWRCVVVVRVGGHSGGVRACMYACALASGGGGGGGLSLSLSLCVCVCVLCVCMLFCAQLTCVVTNWSNYSDWRCNHNDRAVFKFLCDVYSKKFPELESMVGTVVLCGLCCTFCRPIKH